MPRFISVCIYMATICFTSSMRFSYKTCNFVSQYGVKGYNIPFLKLAYRISFRRWFWFCGFYFLSWLISLRKLQRVPARGAPFRVRPVGSVGGTVQRLRCHLCFCVTLSWDYPLCYYPSCINNKSSSKYK